MRETDAQRPDPPQGERRHTSSSQGVVAGGRGSELLAKQPSAPRRQAPTHTQRLECPGGKQGLQDTEQEAHVPKMTAGLEPHWVSRAGFRREKS